jgi:hypothetical protein
MSLFYDMQYIIPEQLEYIESPIKEPQRIDKESASYGLRILYQKASNSDFVPCINLPFGCKWCGVKSYFLEHYETCSESRIKCPNEGCFNILPRKYIQDHLYSTNCCEFTRGYCKKCGIYDFLRKMRKNHKCKYA